MKTIRLLPAVFLAAVVPTLKAAAADSPVPRAEVIFDHPEKFTDVKDSVQPSEKGRDAILDQIRNYIVLEARYAVPEGYKLTITFTNIDLAGDFEPWRGTQWADIRVVKDIYPPALKFSYSLADPAGKVVKRGSEDIRDLNFQMRVILDQSDPLRYEKDILKEWMRSKLSDLKRP